MIFRYILLSSILFLPGLSVAQKVDIYQRPFQEERSRDYNALHYRIELTFDLDRKYFSGTNQITLTALKNNFSACKLDAEELKVTGISMSGSKGLNFNQDDAGLIVDLGHEYNYGDTVIFTVEYYAEDPKTGLYFVDGSSDNPQMVVTDSWPNRARHWFPCYDYPNVKSTQEIIIHADPDLKVLSNGRLVGVKADHGTGLKTWYWSQEKPHCTYLSMLAIGPFEVIEDSLGDLPVNYWVYRENIEDARWAFAKTPYMIAFFNELYGYEYPWAKYDQVISPKMGGGAEATSATILGQGLIHNRRAEQDFSAQQIIAHEIAHQWWGDLITLRTWSHAWLNESFATYSDYLYTRYDKGEDDGAYDLHRKKEQYLREARDKYIRPIVFNRYDHPAENFDSHSYPKGAIVLHMLRDVLGDDLFFRCLAYFLHKHAFQSVETYDFMTAIKEVTGQNLDWFFEQFIYRPGHVVFQVKADWDENRKMLLMDIGQVQDTTKGVPFAYRMPVKIGIRTSEGNLTQKLWLDERNEKFEFELVEKPFMVRFDEGNRLLKEWTFEKDTRELLYQLKEDDVIGRSWAAAELVKHGGNEDVVKALEESARTDSYWLVRQASLEALDKVAPGERTALYKKMAGDPDSRVRITSIRLLGKSTDKNLVDFFKKMYKDDDSYLVQAKALRSIGRCGGPGDISFLEVAREADAPRDVIKIAAQWAISKIQKQTIPN